MWTFKKKFAKQPLPYTSISYVELRIKLHTFCVVQFFFADVFSNFLIWSEMHNVKYQILFPMNKAPFLFTN